MPSNISNYDKTRDAMAEKFLRYDQEKMINKFRLENDAKYLYISFLNRRYRVGRENGRTEWLDNADRAHAAGYNEAMTIYDVLCCSKDDCLAAREMVNIASLSSVMGGTLAGGDGFFQRYAEMFDDSPNLLKRVCACFPGRVLNGGDAAYEFELFPFLTVALRFWRSDDEFPASLQLLADKNILDFMHYETMMFAFSHLLESVAERINDEGGCMV